MDSYKCDVCDWVYNPEEGYPEGGIAPGTPFEDLPDDFECPQFHADVSGTMDAITATGKLTPEQTDTILNAWKAYEGGESHGVQ